MDIDDQQSIRSSSSIELVDRDDELELDNQLDADEISADKGLLVSILNKKLV